MIDLRLIDGESEACIVVEVAVVDEKQ